MRRDRESLARAIVRIARRVRILTRATPINLRAELTRLEKAWEQGVAEAPRFVYGAPLDLAAEQATLAAVRAAVEVRSGDVYTSGLAEIYEARAAELAVEAAACDAVGTDAFWGFARKLRPRRDRFDDEADELAPVWAAAPPEDASDEAIFSDDPLDSRSLLRAMQRAAYEQRLAVRVLVSRELSPLAATGEGAIFVAAGRRVSSSTVARTVLHEVHGHALPAARASVADLPLFQAGTAFGSDDQEGRAIALEERAEMLGPVRRRELGLRHLAARSVEQRAHFVDTTRLLLSRGARTGEALRIAARSHRGGGLAREGAYIPAFLRASAAFAENPELDNVLANGRISIDAARFLVVRGLWRAPRRLAG